MVSLPAAAHEKGLAALMDHHKEQLEAVRMAAAGQVGGLHTC